MNGNGHAERTEQEDRKKTAPDQADETRGAFLMDKPNGASDHAEKQYHIDGNEVVVNGVIATDEMRLRYHVPYCTRKTVVLQSEEEQTIHRICVLSSRIEYHRNPCYNERGMWFCLIDRTMRTMFLSCLLFCLTLPLFGADDKPWLIESKDRPFLPKRERMLWADSMQAKDVTEICGEPIIEIERWVNEPPKDLTGKFVLIEVWATWCPPCRRSLPLLEYFHEKYKDELVVISICETDCEKNEKAIEDMKGALKLADMKAPLAIDTHRRFANALGVYGIPHAVLIDPIMGAVIWEGMPTQIGAELSDEFMAKILANLKNPAVQAKLPKKAPFEIKAMPPDPNKKYRPAPENVGNAGW